MPNMPNYLCVFSPIISFVMNVIFQILIFRYMNTLGLLKSVFIAFIFGICVLTLIEAYYITQVFSPLIDSVPFVLINIITYSSLGYCYFHFINLGETARRIRILRELYNSKEGLSMEELLEHYNVKEMIKRRIERLLCNGQISMQGGKYYIKGRTMLFMANIIIAMKIGLLNKRSEYDFN